MTQTVSPALLDRFASIVGEGHVLRAAADIAPHLVENRGLYHGASPMVLKPGSVAEVSAILKLASETGTAIVPQTGNTGLVGGQTPREGSADILVSLERMTRIRDVDPVGNTMVVDAGCILAEVQKAAEEHGRLFPLSLGSEGSCRIGGNLSTNAGGTAVLAYGNMRQLCLGLEVVLPTGEIWDGLRRLKKDNTGYDLRDLFIGAEGTLGIITGAVLKLFPQPLGHQVAFAGIASVEDALTLFKDASSRLRSGADRLRADAAHRRRIYEPPHSRRARSAFLAASLVCADRHLDLRFRRDRRADDDGAARTGL